MIRQRMRLRGSAFAWVARAVVVIFGVALSWYGLMLVLLALKADPDFVNKISGYRTALDWLSALTPSDITPDARLFAGIAGALAFLVFGFVAWRELPRPYLTRGDVWIPAAGNGQTVLAPRAVERMAEAAALELPAVAGAAARLDGERLTVSVTPRAVRDLPETLRAARMAVRQAFGEHGLSVIPVDVVLTGLLRKQRRELA